MTRVHRAAVALGGCLIVGAIAYVASRPKIEKPMSNAPAFIQEFHVIQQDCDQRLAALFKDAKQRVEAEKTLEKRQQLVTSLQRQGEAIASPAAKKALQLVRSHGADFASVEPLIWIVQRGNDTTGSEAVSILTKYHLTHSLTLDLARQAAESNKSWVEPLLRAQLAVPDLPEESQRPQQILALAMLLQRMAEEHTGDTRKLEEEAIALFTDLGDKYAGEKVGSGVTMGDVSKTALLEINHLGVGKTPPDIKGTDLDGVAFKLSDYRGKVVLVSFWGSWCAPCMALIPHERDLVARYKDKPFALIGVNSDPDKEKLKPVMEAQHITWRSFWCGEEGPTGAIPRAWNVNNWPTVYLIDPAGVIRWKRSLGTPLDPVLEKLIAATDEGEKTKRTN